MFDEPLHALHQAITAGRLDLWYQGEVGDAPRGTLRLHVSSGADTVLAGPLLADFLTEHPHVGLDVVVSDAR